MPKTKFPSVSYGAANSIAAPTEGWADATTTTTPENIDLTAWAGSYITIECETDDHYVLFDTDGSTTIQAGAQATVGSGDVPRTIYSGAPNPPMVVPPGKPFLVYRAVAATGTLRVTRS